MLCFYLQDIMYFSRGEITLPNTVYSLHTVLGENLQASKSLTIPLLCKNWNNSLVMKLDENLQASKKFKNFLVMCSKIWVYVNYIPTNPFLFQDFPDCNFLPSVKKFVN